MKPTNSECCMYDVCVCVCVGGCVGECMNTIYLSDGFPEFLFQSPDMLWIWVLGTEQHPTAEVLVPKKLHSTNDMTQSITQCTN